MKWFLVVSLLFFLTWVTAQVKITELDRNGRITVDTEDVVGLDVPVGDASAVKEPDGLGQVGDHSAGLGLGETDTGLNMIQQRTTRDFLKYEAKSVILLKIFDQLNNILLTPTQVIYLNLFQNFATVIKSGRFLNNFHCVFYLGVNIDAGANSSIASFAKHLTS